MKEQKTKRIKTTQQSLEILKEIGDVGGASITEIAESMDVSKSTAYKHLRTFAENGFLRKEGETYKLGFGLVNLGEAARTSLPSIQKIEETVDELTERTGEEVDFVVESNGRIVAISESYNDQVNFDVDLEGRAGYRARTGTYYHMHSTAPGKAILSQLPKKRVRSIIDRWGLPELTETTITDEESLFTELEQVRQRGYAIGDEEFASGVRSVAQAVRLPDNSVLGAICIFGPTYRINGPVLELELPEVLEESVKTLESEIDEGGLYLPVS